MCVAADISEPQARTLRNYARRIVLTFLGLKGMYDEPEINTQVEDVGHAGVTEDGSGEDDADSETDKENEDDAWVNIG